MRKEDCKVGQKVRVHQKTEGNATAYSVEMYIIALSENYATLQAIQGNTGVYYNYGDFSPVFDFLQDVYVSDVSEKNARELKLPCKYLGESDGHSYVMDANWTVCYYQYVVGAPKEVSLYEAREILAEQGYRLSI